MAKQNVYELAKLARTIGDVVGRLEEWDQVQEDESWIGTGQLPPDPPVVGPEHALRNVRYVMDSITEAQSLASALPGAPLIRETRVALALAWEAIGQADVPIDDAIRDGQADAAIGCAREALFKARNQSGMILAGLVPRLLVAAGDGLQGNGDSDTSREPAGKITAEAGQAPNEAKATGRTKWLGVAMQEVNERPDLPDAEIARRVGVDKSRLSRSESYQKAAALARSRNAPPRGTKDKEGHIEASDEDNETDAEES